MKVGLVGWRGMVGSVLMQRMEQEQDFALIDPHYFSSSNPGRPGPDGKSLHDAFSIDQLASMQTIISCQGGDYTQRVYPLLRAAGWDGFWIDAASTLRMNEDAVIVLDPLNRHVIDQALAQGTKTFVGGNCTVSLMMMGLNGLFRENRIEWITAMTYQAASGAGAANMRELLLQMGELHHAVAPDLANPQSSILDIDAKVSATLRAPEFPTENFQAALAGSLIPWIDKDLGNGTSREEWKGDVECNKILGTLNQHPNRVIVDSLCVRIGAMRCHSQALTICLREDTTLEHVEQLIASGNEWVELIPNTREASIARLNPATVNGTLRIPVGRVRPLAMNPRRYFSAFTVGDQLLWGAAEPLRRMLRILLAQS